MKRIYQRQEFSALTLATTRKIFFACAILFLTAVTSGFSQKVVSKNEGTSTPVTLTSFTAKGLNSDKVLLNWNTSQEKYSSHFTIEKSLDGKDFSDAGIVFSMGNSEQPQQYSFTDKLRAGEKGIIYYRLKIVDIDGKTARSPIKVVRIGHEKVQAAILVYPNPVVTELRVALPADWHDKKVTIDIFSANGILAKHYT